MQNTSFVTLANVTSSIDLFQFDYWTRWISIIRLR